MPRINRIRLKNQTKNKLDEKHSSESNKENIKLLYLNGGQLSCMVLLAIQICEWLPKISMTKGQDYNFP